MVGVGQGYGGCRSGLWWVKVRVMVVKVRVMVGEGEGYGG